MFRNKIQKMIFYMHFNNLILKILLKSVKLLYNSFRLKIFSVILSINDVFTLHEQITFSIELSYSIKLQFSSQIVNLLLI